MRIKARTVGFPYRPTQDYFETRRPSWSRREEFNRLAPNMIVKIPVTERWNSGD